jgi:hypothetical protein
MGKLSVRIKSKQNGQINHDTRKSFIKYLKNNEQNIFYDRELNQYKFSTLETEKQIEFKNIIQKDFNQLKREMKKDDKEFNDKSSIQKNTKFSFSGIITFSPTMKKDYKDNPKLFNEKLKQFIKEFEEKHNTKILYSTIHLDEKTPHIHFEILNYNFEKHRTLKRSFTKQDLRNLQDLGGDIFQDFGKGYERGIKKEITGAVNLTVSQSHQVEQFRKIIQNILEKSNLPLEELRKMKNELVEQTRNEEDIYIKEGYKSTLKELTKKINSHNKIIKQIKKNITPLIEKNKNIIGGVDTEKLSNDLVLLFELNKKLDTTHDLTELKSLYDTLQDTNEKLSVDSQEETIRGLKEDLKNKDEIIERKTESLKTSHQIERDLKIANNELKKKIILLETELKPIRVEREKSKIKKNKIEPDTLIDL